MPTTQRSLRILHFITDLRRGGESTILLSLLPWLQSQGTENILCCITPNTDGRDLENLVPEFRKLGIEVHDLEVDSRFELFKLFKLIWVILRVKPNILHCYLFHSNVFGRLVSILFPRMKVISSVVSSDDWKRWWHSAAEGFTSLFSDSVLVNAEIVRKVLVERDWVPRGRIDLIYNGVDLTRLDPPSPEQMAAVRARYGIQASDFVVGYVGRLHPAKDPACMVRSFAIFQRAVPEAKLLLVGGGKIRDELEELARSLGIEGRVIFAGNVHEDIASHYACMHLFAISSKLEGIPAVLFEAMKMKVPVVSFPVGGVPEVVEDGKSAILAKAHTPEGLGEALLEAYRERDRLPRLTECAHQTVMTRFNNIESYQQRLKLYRSLVDGHR